ncbi:MAG: prolyl oligopeptidase family serine peptidase [Candidatus Caldarchaeales archaeon]
MDLRGAITVASLASLIIISSIVLFLILSPAFSPYLNFSEEFYEGVRLIVCKPEVQTSPALIVVHGGKASSRTSVEFCRGFYERLNDLKITVISVDYPENLTLVEEIEYVIKSVEYAETRKFIDREKICVLGVSRGGYLALMTAVKTNVKCVVDAYGPTDLKDMFGYARGDPALWSEWQWYYVSLMEYAESRDIDEEKVMGDLSPLNNARLIEEDVLIMHGLNDESIPPKHSIMLTDAFRSVGKTNYILKLYEDEVHGFSLLKGRPYEDLREFLSNVFED